MDTKITDVTFTDDGNGNLKVPKAQVSALLAALLAGTTLASGAASGAGASNQGSGTQSTSASSSGSTGAGPSGGQGSTGAGAGSTGTPSSSTGTGSGTTGAGSAGSGSSTGAGTSNSTLGSVPASLVHLWVGTDAATASDGSVTWTDRVNGLKATAAAAAGVTAANGRVSFSGKGAFVTAGVGKLPLGASACAILVSGQVKQGSAFAYGNADMYAWRKLAAWGGSGHPYASDYDVNPEMPEDWSTGEHVVRADFGASKARGFFDGKAYGPWPMAPNTVASRAWIGGSASGEFMVGSLAWVAVFDGTVTDSDVKAVTDMLSGSSGSAPGSQSSSGSAPAGTGSASAGSSTGSTGTGSTPGTSGGQTPSSGSSSGQAGTSSGSTTGTGSSGSPSGTGSTPSSSGASGTPSTGAQSGSQAGGSQVGTMSTVIGTDGMVVGGIVGNGHAGSAYDPANNDIPSVAPTDAYLAAAQANNLGTIRATPPDSGSSIQVVKPFKSAVMNVNQQPKYHSSYVASSDVPTKAVKDYVLTGLWTGAVKNVEVMVCQDAAIKATVNADGTWTAGPIDLTKYPDGPTPIQVNAWDVLAGGTPTLTLNLKYRLLLVNPAMPSGVPSRGLPKQVLALFPNGLTETFRDDFDDPTKTLTENFHLGTNARNEEWGSDSYFVRSNDPQTWINDSYRFPLPSWIALRAVRDEAFVSPWGWTTGDQASNEKDHWRTGLLSGGFPPPAGGTRAVGKGMLTKGVWWIRELLPEGLGIWPSFWGVNAGHVVDKSGAGEIDFDESSVWGDPFAYGGLTCHDWSGGDGGKQIPANATANAAGTVRTLTNGRVRSMQVMDWYYVLTDTDCQVWLDDGTGNAQCMGIRPRPVVPDKDDPYYMMIDMPIGGWWPYDVPLAGYYDRFLDFEVAYQAN